MKQFKFLATSVAVCMVVSLSSCGGGGDKKVEEITTDSSTVTVVEPEAPTKPGNFLLIKQRVANYAKWLPT